MPSYFHIHPLIKIHLEILDLYFFMNGSFFVKSNQSEQEKIAKNAKIKIQDKNHQSNKEKQLILFRVAFLLCKVLLSCHANICSSIVLIIEGDDKPSILHRAVF